MQIKWLIAAAVLVVVTIMVPLRMSGICSRQEEREWEDGRKKQ